MNHTRRLDPLQHGELELAADEDEELPDYSPAPAGDSEAAPAYTTVIPTPLHTYHLRQMDRKLQLFVPYGPSAAASYKVTFRSARLFSKKAEIDIWRTTSYTQAGTSTKEEEHVAGVWFDNDGPLPWRPRAHFVQNNDGSGSSVTVSSTYALESQNFTDWSFEVDGRAYAWLLEGHSSSYLALRDMSDDGEMMLARFNFSCRGTTAMGGAEAGDLSIYRHGLGLSESGVDKMVCGLVVALAHFKKMGRHYKNDMLMDGEGQQDQMLRRATI